MTPVAWMVGASVASWLVVTAEPDGRGNPEVLLGMAGPLRRRVVSWVRYERTHAVGAQSALTSVMITALALKMVFFGVYVARDAAGAGAASDAVRRELHGLLHRAARDRGAVPAAPVDDVMRSPSRERT